eukprot:c17955_g1_i1.p1 GENE.c17955_g1_i1~~c17955_g1_i1.p1  ORF type:complete len:579 (+),score=122.61 c17955_g1_i1:1-1737(+)
MGARTKVLHFVTMRRPRFASDGLELLWSAPWLCVVVVCMMFLTISFDTWVFGTMPSSSLWVVTTVIFVCICLQLRIAQGIRRRIIPPIPELKLSRPVRVAIIGGGVGGGACSVFVRELLEQQTVSEDSLELDGSVHNPENKNALVEIHLFAKDLGGRTKNVECGGGTYEGGGAVIHRKNWYMRQFAYSLGLSVRSVLGMTLGIHNGTSFDLIPRSIAFATKVSVLLRYGRGLFKINSYVNSTLRSFAKIYDLQDKGKGFTSVQGMLEAMDPNFYKNTQIDGRTLVTQLGCCDKLVNELVDGVMRCNYAQTSAQLNGFTTAVSLAGVQKGELWQVVGGNEQIPKELSDTYCDQVFESEVTSITRLPAGSTNKYRVKWENQTADYDVVVIAHPLERSNIRFEGFSSPPVPNSIQNRRFRKVYAHFIQGQLHPNFAAQAKAAGGVCPKMVFTGSDFKAKGFDINSIGLQVDVNMSETEADLFIASFDPSRDTAIWKVFAPAKLSTAELRELFLNPEDVVVLEWYAYPEYSPPEKLNDFVLDEGLYYINAIETASSAMEMSAIGARNVALLIRESLINSPPQ